MQQARGFTLLELIITMVILVIIAFYAAPSFDRLMRQTTIDSNTTKIRNALNYARSEAVNLGATVTVCSSTNFLDCNGDEDWESGWMVFIDRDAGADFDGDPATNPCVTGMDCLLRQWDPLLNGVALVEIHDESSVTYTEQGAVLNAKDFSLQLTVPGCGADELRTLSLNAIGRLEVSTGDCP